MRLKDKVVIITGAGSGIGRESAMLFSHEGAKIVVAEINEQDGKKTVDEIKQSGGEAFFAKVDVSDRNDIKKMVEETMEKYGKIDILVNNAGIIQDALLIKMTEEQWDRVVEINLKGVFNCAQAVAPIMVAQGSGRIINTSSVVAIYGNVGQTNYAATKAALIGFTKSLGKELGRKGIRVNAVAPGFIMTAMTDKVPEDILEMMKEKTPVRKLGRPIDVAYAYLYLASDESDYVNCAVLNIDGGLTV